jgi:hypothetical protein
MKRSGQKNGFIFENNSLAIRVPFSQIPGYGAALNIGFLWLLNKKRHDSWQTGVIVSLKSLQKQRDMF